MKQIIVDNTQTNYYITEDGKCLNSQTNKYLKGQISNSGYLNFNLTLSTGKRRLYAHRLVAEAYIPNPDNKPEVNHLNGNKLDNRIENLEWTTRAENSRYNTLIGNNKNVKRVYQFDKDKNLVRQYLCINDVQKEGYTVSMISQEMNKKVKTLTQGYYWNNSEDSSFQVQNYDNTGKSKQVLCYNKNTMELIAIYPSANEAARQLGIAHSHISECCRGKVKSYKGYIWKYSDD